MTLVITTCTNRKRKAVSERLHVSALRHAPVADLAVDWGQRLAATNVTYPASDIYGGRSFQEAARAADLLGAPLMIVSAGLGLISAEERVPPYACTVIANGRDSVAARAVGEYSVRGWWQALVARSPFSQPLLRVLAKTEGLVCAALSDTYIEMIAGDLAALPDTDLRRLRLFTRAPTHRVTPVLRPSVMPYDDRLDGPDSLVRGTRGDFAGRALRHFAEHIVVTGDQRSSECHADAVRAALAGWRMAPRFDRARVDDAAMLGLIRDYWDAERGSTARLLRRVRDDLHIACEQGRFAELARQVRGERR